jgi:hypothetical protein
MTTGPEVKTASIKKDQSMIPTDNHSFPRPSETGINFQLTAQCRATQQVFHELFTFKTIPNLQLKLCTLYVVHFLPVLDLRAALNPSIVSAL